MSGTSPVYRWTLRRGTEPGTVEIRMIDAWGWEIVGTGTLQPDKTYAGTAMVTSKGSLALPGLDEVSEL